MMNLIRILGYSHTVLGVSSSCLLSNLSCCEEDFVKVPSPLCFCVGRLTIQYIRLSHLGGFKNFTGATAKKFPLLKYVAFADSFILYLLPQIGKTSVLVITYLPLVPAQNFGCAYIQKYSDKIKQTRKAEKEPWSAKTGQICPPPISIRHPLSHLSALYNTTRDAISLREHLLNLQYLYDNYKV